MPRGSEWRVFVSILDLTERNGASTRITSPASKFRFAISPSPPNFDGATSTSVARESDGNTVHFLALADANNSSPAFAFPLAIA
jgi:hypothetical protein